MIALRMRIPEQPNLGALPDDVSRDAAWAEYRRRMEVYAAARGDSMTWREYDGLTPREKGWLCYMVMRRLRHGAPLLGAAIKPPSEFEAQCLLVDRAALADVLIGRVPDHDYFYCHISHPDGSGTQAHP